MAKSRKRPAPGKRSRVTRERAPGRDVTFQLSGDGVALSLEPVRNPIPRGTFGSIGRFFRVSSDRPFAQAPILIPYESRGARHVDESTLGLFRWDEERASFVLVPDCGVNVTERYVWGQISSPGIYGLIGLPKDERVLRTVALIASFDPAEFRTNRALLPKVCGLILCARGPGGGPAGGNLCDLCLGLEIPQLGLPEGQLVGRHFPGGYIPPPPTPVPAGAPWPMYGHDPRHTGRSAHPGPATQPTVLWKFNPSPHVMNAQLSHPVVDENGVVYIGTSGQAPTGARKFEIFALDGATGAKKWSSGWYPLTNTVFFTPQPAVGTDGTIYSNIGDMLFALKPNGSVKWAVGGWSPIGGSWAMISQSPIPAADGAVYMFNWLRVQGSSLNGLLAFDGANGTLKWQSGFDTGMGGFLPIAVRDDGSIIVGGTDIWALSSNKTIQWKHTLSGVRVLEGSPAVADDGTVYVGVRPVPLTMANLRGLAANGTPKANWTPPPWCLTTPAVAADGTVYIGFQAGGLFPWGGARIDARNPDGTLKWSRAIPGEVLEAPAIGGDGTIYLCSGNPQPGGTTGATVYALDPATGLDRWTLPLGQGTWCQRSPAIGRNSTLYIVDASTGTLIALK